MKLVWSERKPAFGTGKLGQLMELLGGGSWAMGEGFDYFIEPISVGNGISYILDQTTVNSGGLRVVRHIHGDNVEALEQVAQQWEDE